MPGLNDNRFPEDSDTIASSIANMLSPMLGLYMQNIDKMVQPFGISAGQTKMLIYLSKNNGHYQKDIANKLGVTAPSMTTMVTRMEKNGLVERVKSEEDHRASKVFLTQKGHKVIKKMNSVIHFVNERNLAGFRLEERVLFLRLMEHMYKNLEKQNYELSLIKKEKVQKEDDND